MGRSGNKVSGERVSGFGLARYEFTPQDADLGRVIDLRTGAPELRWESNTELRPAYFLTKRVLDLVVAAPLVVILSPLYIALALMVALSSPGPVFFRQERVGRFGKCFNLLKFRTMADGADESQHRHHSEQLANGNKYHLLIEDDPRVTSVGAFLRRWSLDELPNVWNVIKGEMSLVGPRPLVPYELMLHRGEQLRRLEVPPGMTGLAQVSGRLQISLDERADHDLDYVDRCSFFYDLGLMLRTVPAVLTRPGA